MKLEICANSFRSAQSAQEAGAHRIELCSELSVGGITPSYGLIKSVLKYLDIDVFVLIRPRSGNFNYSDSEFEIMKENVQLCKKMGCSGVVSGVLNEDLTIDVERTKLLMELAQPMSFTFHRAFDCVPNPEIALEILLDLGVDRILTSGQAKTAEKGIGLITTMHEKVRDKVIIMAGSGINPINAKLFKNKGLLELHASASKTIEASEKSAYFEDQTTYSDPDTIRAIIKQIQ